MNVLDKLYPTGKLQTAIADTWREKLVTKSVKISVFKEKKKKKKKNKLGVLCTVVRQLNWRPNHFFVLMLTSIIELYCLSFWRIFFSVFSESKFIFHLRETSKKCVFYITPI